MKLNLGIIKSNNEIKNHRSLFKIILNPFLRYFFGNFLVTQANDNNKIGFYQIKETEIKKSLKEELKSSWIYELNENDIIEFKRWLI
jgi:hypothetical protein